jgi:hypothetical protein
LEPAKEGGRGEHTFRGILEPVLLEQGEIKPPAFIFTLTIPKVLCSAFKTEAAMRQEQKLREQETP